MTWAKRGIVLALAAALLYCVALATFYTSERRWVQSGMIGKRIAYVGELVPHAQFSAALPGCLKSNDPLALATFERTGSYRMSGWFVPKPQARKVVRCMRSKGWELIPVRLYTP